MSEGQLFSPDWASPPADTILDILKDRAISPERLARQMNSSIREVYSLLELQKPLTIDLARKLSAALGSSVEFWMARDYQYQQSRQHLQAQAKRWLSSLPLTDMERFGWLKPHLEGRSRVQSCLDFFGVSSVSAWYEIYAGPTALAAFRRSQTYESQPSALAAWLRQGEVEAASIDCQPWSPTGLWETLPVLRELTRRKHPSDFVSSLRGHCALSGVAIVIVRTPSGCSASGATRFITPDKALVQMSFRYLSDDHFWFTLFHELGHLLLHSKQQVFLEGDQEATDTEEIEANEFAQETLIPSRYRKQLLRLPASHRAVIQFARQVGVAPGIVVGQLQHEGKIDYNWLNKLKRRYRWEEEVRKGSLNLATKG